MKAAFWYIHPTPLLGKIYCVGGDTGCWYPEARFSTLLKCIIEYIVIISTPSTTAVIVPNRLSYLLASIGGRLTS
jgi:hypothetical protein